MVLQPPHHMIYKLWGRCLGDTHGLPEIEDTHQSQGWGEVECFYKTLGEPGDIVEDNNKELWMIVHNSFRNGDNHTPDIYYLEVQKLRKSITNIKRKYENAI